MPEAGAEGFRRTDTDPVVCAVLPAAAFAREPAVTWIRGGSAP
ncbi:hypothetical protein ACIRL2_47030 [Embleya sp. NPDC127516]